MKRKRSKYVTKYYVCSGKNSWLVENESPILAALDIYDKHKLDVTFGPFFYVDERGFRTVDAEERIPFMEVIVLFDQQDMIEDELDDGPALDNFFEDLGKDFNDEDKAI